MGVPQMGLSEGEILVIDTVSQKKQIPIKIMKYVINFGSGVQGVTSWNIFLGLGEPYPIYV